LGNKSFVYIKLEYLPKREGGFKMKRRILIIFSLLILSTFSVNDNFMSPLVAQAATTTTVSKVASVKKSYGHRDGA
jgi:hypothetical protein